MNIRRMRAMLAPLCILLFAELQSLPGDAGEVTLTGRIRAVEKRELSDLERISALGQARNQQAIVVEVHPVVSGKEPVKSVIVVLEVDEDSPDFLRVEIGHPQRVLVGETARKLIWSTTTFMVLDPYYWTEGAKVTIRAAPSGAAGHDCRPAEIRASNGPDDPSAVRLYESEELQPFHDLPVYCARAASATLEYWWDARPESRAP